MKRITKKDYQMLELFSVNLLSVIMGVINACEKEHQCGYIDADDLKEALLQRMEDIGCPVKDELKTLCKKYNIGELGVEKDAT